MSTLFCVGHVRVFFDAADDNRHYNNAMSNGGWVKAIIAGLLLWVAMSLVAFAHQPAHAGAPIATIYTVLALIVAVIACLILRW